MGPQPGTAAEATPDGTPLRLIVQVVDSSFTDPAKRTTAALTGRLTLRGVRPASGAASGAEGVVVEVQNGWGEVAVTRSGALLLEGELRVTSVGNVETLLLDNDLPGTHDGWLRNSLIGETTAANVIALRSTPLPVGASGPLTLRVEVQFYWPDQLKRFVTDPRQAATLTWGQPGDWNLVPSTISPGRDLTDAELQQVRGLIGLAVRGTRAQVQTLIRVAEKRNVPAPIIAIEQTQLIDAARPSFHYRVRWLAAAKGQLAIA